jgi:hypothetical protein
MKITSEDIEWFKKAHNIIAEGHYPDGKKAINLYNKIFEEEIKQGKMRGNLSPGCGGCIREAVNKTYEAIIRLERQTNGQNTKTKDKETGTSASKGENQRK